MNPLMSATPSNTSNVGLAPLTKNDRYLATPFDSRPQTSPLGSTWERTAMATSTTSSTSTETSLLALPDPSPTSRLQLPAPPPLGAPSASQPVSSGGNTGWNSGTNGAASTRDSNLVPVVPLSSRRQDQPPATSQQTNPWAAEDDRWSWPTDGQTAAASQPAVSPPHSDWSTQPPSQSPIVPLRSDWPAASTTTAAASSWGDPAPANPATAAQPQSTTWPTDLRVSPPVQTAVGQPVGSQPGGTQLSPAGPGAIPLAQSPAPGVSGATPQSGSTPQPPWMPLLLVSLGLAGSIGANFFLGWSYMDARQKYRMLVRKTADAFNRATSAAA